ncbi:spore coat protein U domain-containing protein [Pantoea ananatis]|uniref:spore coat protein U domain-containing protein n=1 Tax=Pantoea ananas TaxID=553 RepID=UPI00234FFBAA|nr:spore coat protein U domain-containing protein [Pantoea ananatis]
MKNYKLRWILMMVAVSQMIIPLTQAKTIQDPDPTNPKDGIQKIDNSISVNAEINNGCVFEKNSYELKLIPDAGFETATASEMEVDIQCTLNSNLNLSLDNGLYYSGASKRLKNSEEDYIPYDIIMSEQPGGAGVTQLTHTFSNGINYKFYIRASADITSAKVGYYQDTVTFITSF